MWLTPASATKKTGHPSPINLFSILIFITVSGEVVNVYPGGFTLATEQGFVNLLTDTDTIIYSGMTGMHSEVPLGWKVIVEIDESPYIVGRALVPYGSILIVNYVLERLWFNYHDMCTVIGQTGPGKIPQAKTKVSSLKFLIFFE